MGVDILFEHHWLVDEGALRRAQLLWLVFGVVIAVLGSAVMIGLHGWTWRQALPAAAFFFSIGALGAVLWEVNARTRRSAHLSVGADGRLEVGVLKHRGVFVLADCREVRLDKSWRWKGVFGYDLVVVGERPQAFVLPGHIGASGNSSTLTDDEMAAFHAAVSRFLTARPPTPSAPDGRSPARPGRSA